MSRARGLAATSSQQIAAGVVHGRRVDRCGAARNVQRATRAPTRERSRSLRNRKPPMASQIRRFICDSFASVSHGTRAASWFAPHSFYRCRFVSAVGTRLKIVSHSMGPRYRIGDVTGRVRTVPLTVKCPEAALHGGKMSNRSVPARRRGAQSTKRVRQCTVFSDFGLLSSAIRSLSVPIHHRSLPVSRSARQQSGVRNVRSRGNPNGRRCGDP
jgi:hypothetical protein